MTANKTEQPFKKAIELDFRTAEVGNDKMRISYRLIKAFVPEEIYVITVKSEDCFSAEAVGSEKEHAQTLFNMIFDGKATPCSLSDICRDISCEKII